MFQIKMKNDSFLGEDEITPLLELGLNRYEASIYLTLINEGTSTAKDVSNITGIPYGKIYEIIDSLTSKGFVNILPSKPMKCQPVSPKVAIENTKKHMHNKLQQLETHVIKKLEPKYESCKKFVDPRGIFLLLNGRANIYRKVEELLKTSSDKINILTTENGLKRLVAHKELLEGATKRGVKIKISAPLTTENKEDSDLLSFCEVKHSKEAHNTMYTFDSAEAIIVDTIPDDENYISGRDFGVHSKSESFSKFIDSFYKTYFTKSANATVQDK